jgi:hypothetical protein
VNGDAKGRETCPSLFLPGRQTERTLVRGAIVNRVAVRDDHVLERKVEERSKGGQHPLLVPGSAPDAKRALPLRERVGEDEDALLRKPEGRFVAPPSVVERMEPTGKLGPRLDGLDLCRRDVVPPEERGAVGPGGVALDEEVDVPDVVGLEDDDDRGPRRVDSLPELAGVIWWGQGIEQRHLPTRLDDGRGDVGLPARAGAPVRMRAPPDPEPVRDIPNLRRLRPSYTRAMAEIAHIWRSPKHRELMEELETAQVFENEGVEGCAHRRGGKRNVLFVAAENLESLAIAPGRVKENFTVRGADVMNWPIGQRLVIGEAEFEVSMVCDPCELMEEIRPGLQAELEGKRGMLAKVTKTGRVTAGDEVVLGH